METPCYLYRSRIGFLRQIQLHLANTGFRYRNLSMLSRSPENIVVFMFEICSLGGSGHLDHRISACVAGNFAGHTSVCWCAARAESLREMGRLAERSIRRRRGVLYLWEQ